MKLTQEQVNSWAGAEMAAKGHQLFSSGAVQGVQANETRLMGALKVGASRLTTTIQLIDGRPKVTCVCPAAHQHGMCMHAVAVALEWLK
ncbi:MAG: hypothetical protein J6V91_01840, partial [Kiritimatiellae bacterium]|nr:hypothetical protein [Kiritimatiellia bacterium]